MKIEETGFTGLRLIKPKVFGDERGYFFESWNRKTFEKHGLPVDFDQDNQSLSQSGVLRGMHFQSPPHEQGKLVRVIQGAVLDVAIDIRTNSGTYGKHFAVELNETNKTMMWIPPGFAHGFLTLKDETIFVYKCLGAYAPEAEQSLAWNDPDFNIDWGIKNPLLSQKDQGAQAFKDFKSPFS